MPRLLRETMGKLVEAPEDQDRAPEFRNFEIGQAVAECIEIPTIIIGETKSLTHFFVKRFEGRPCSSVEAIRLVPVALKPEEVIVEHCLLVVEGDRMISE